MRIPDVIQSNPVYEYEKTASQVGKSPNNQEIYRSTLSSYQRKASYKIGEFIAQWVEAFAMVALLPFFIYTLFIVTVSAVMVPFVILLMPFFLASKLVREILHWMMPFLFEDQSYSTRSF